MRLRSIFIIVVWLVCGCSPSWADPMEQIAARLDALEKRNEALAKENASLKQRVSRLETVAAPVVANAASAPAIAPTTTSSSPVVMTTSAVVPTSAQYSEPTAPQDLNTAAFNWSGVYIGLHGGGASGDLSYSDTVPGLFFGVETFRGDLNASGALGGIQIGANKQFGNVVVGAEISVSGANISGSQTDSCLELDATCKARVNYLVTALARLGYAHDRWLVSASAGWTLAGADYSNTFDVGIPVTSTSNETLDGFTYGAGFNYALTDSVSIGAEYLHADLNANGPAFLAPLTGIGKGERDLDLNIGRAQLNVKIGP